jgi:hypothetical protein
MNVEILIFILYMCIILHICFYNHIVIKKAETTQDKQELEKILMTENSYIEFFTYASIGITIIFYFYMSFNIYLLMMLGTLLLQFSFSSMKKNILKQLNKE